MGGSVLRFLRLESARRALVGYAGVVGFLGLLGCHAVDVPDGKLPCGVAHDECPSGLRCGRDDQGNKRCYRGSTDASSDAARDGAAAGSGAGGHIATSDGGAAGASGAGGQVVTPDGGAGTGGDTGACDGGTTPCVPANPCHAGQRSCASATAACVDTGASLTDGASCGAGMVCHTGACGACAEGMTCAIAGQACTKGAIVCTTGLPVCTAGGPASPGTPCGTNMVCSAGACVACTAGSACPAANPCHAGKLTCAATPTCVDQGTNLTDGTSCGTGMVCGQGVCVACAANVACNPGGNVCQTGATSCATGASVCAFKSNVMDGTGCGAPKVCLAGACVLRPNGATCAAGTDCASGNCVDGVCCGTSSCAPCNTCKFGGTCTPIGVDARCTASPATCTAGCDGAGHCTAAPNTTICASTCSQSDAIPNGPAHAGAYVTVSLQEKACDGVTIGAAGCKAKQAATCVGFACNAGLTGCRTSCASEADCVLDYRCFGAVCIPKKGIGQACNGTAECASGACMQSFNDAQTVCHGCQALSQCPRNLPICGGNYECTGCIDNFGTGSCNADNSLDCAQHGCTSNATQCGADKKCHCGALAQCPGGMVCEASTGLCRVGAAQRCLNAGDCLPPGQCPAGGGTCPVAATGAPCPGILADARECLSGNCDAPNLLFMCQ
jgi:hypothetical protein